MHTIHMTDKELLFVARLIGNHVCGSGIDRLYEEIYHCQEHIGRTAETLGELVFHTNNPNYPGRPMVSATEQM